MSTSVRAACVALLVLLTGCASTAPSTPTSLAPFPFEMMRVLGGEVSEAEVMRLAPVETTTVPNRHVPDAR